MSARARAASPSNGAVVGGAAVAVAFEQNEQRRRNIEFNAAAFGVSIDVRQQAPDAFDGAAPPSAIFVGGGLTHPGLLDACLDNLPADGTPGGQRRHRRIGIAV